MEFGGKWSIWVVGAFMCMAAKVKRGVGALKGGPYSSDSTRGYAQGQDMSEKWAYFPVISWADGGGVVVEYMGTPALASSDLSQVASAIGLFTLGTMSDVPRV
ncbi:hypothetical protein B0H63DRAFT_212938 [Podospora didyma]|uniref:Uncharacterized protein n=1 Tax=Podospora didyma TaxID=330526 RepID=A0AAE0TW95_9PEZI|nr:hypothetical protein B0H63DRAFT_212938 [Podospora didyma]